MERLDFSRDAGYNAIEASIHFNRYLAAKPYVEGKRVLDFACGEGYGSYLMKQWGAAEVIGVDISEEAIAKARENFSCDGVSFIVQTVEEVSFDEDSFDVVASFETIEYLDHPEKLLKNIARVLRFNGTAIISCPNDALYEQNIADYVNPYHKNKWNFIEFKELTEHYLGKKADWYLGFAANGFTMMPEKMSLFPECDELPQKMMQMIHAQQVSESYTIVSDRYLNHWNANYYLGIWGENTDEQSIQQAVLFPREYFQDPADPTWEAVREAYSANQAQLAILEADYSRQLQEAGQQMERLNEQLRQCKELLAQADETRVAEAQKMEAQKAEMLDLREKLLNDTEGILSCSAKSLAEAEEKVSAMETQFAAAKTEKEKECQALREKMEDQTLMVEQLEDELEQLKDEIAQKEQVIEEDKSALHVSEIEKGRTSQLLRLAEEEKARLWNRISNLEWNAQSEETRLWKEIARLNEEAAKIKPDFDYFQFLKTSKCYRLIQRWWRFKDAVKKGLGRKS